MHHDWKTYYKNISEREPDLLLREALSFVQNRKKALDLGAGSLIESKFLLSQDFEEIIAIDRECTETLDVPNFTFIQEDFEEYTFPPNTFDLINARFALPFAHPDSFQNIWNSMSESLVKRGIFSGHLFGVNDDWSKEKEMTFHTKKEVEDLLVNTEILKLKEVEKDEPTAAGKEKRWHLFFIIFRKK